MEWDETEQPRRRGCGALVGLLVVLVGALGLAWTFGLLGGARASKQSVQLSTVITQTASQLASQGATTARSVGPLSRRIVDAAQAKTTHPHIVAKQGAAVHPKPFRVLFNGYYYEITPHVAADVYWGAKGSTRLLVQYPGESDAKWTSVYYHAFTDDPAQKPAIDDVCRQLRAIRDHEHLGQDQYLELITKYVQSIPYDWALYKSGTGKQRFPVETLVDGKGLCGDKSVLLATLLSHEGYAAALLDFGPEKHMAVGVLGPGPTYKNTGYLFLETTAPGYITDVPAVYSGGMVLKSAPRTIPIGDGTLQYGAVDQITKIIQVRDTAEKAAERLYKNAQSQQLSDSEVTDANRKLAAAYKAQTSLRANVTDRNGKALGTFMDRTTALAWIARNAWWY
jgi:hypothetical protein